MVEVPFPTMVTILPSIVATDVSELVYVYKPLLLDVGFTIVKGAFSVTFAGTEKLVIVDVAWFTVIVAVVVPAK